MQAARFVSVLPAALLAVASTLPLCAQSAAPAAAVNRVTAPIDDNARVVLRGNVAPLAQARFDRGPAPLSTPTGRLALILQRSAAQQQALAQYLSDLQNPASPSFHQWLTPAQYGALFGPSDADLQAVETWLQTQGFRIDKIPAARNLIQFDGSIGQVQTAFHTAIHSFTVNGATHFANISDPQIPAALAPVVAGLTPLNDFHPRPMLQSGGRAHYDPATHSIQPDLTLFSGSTPYLFVGPSDAATIYDTPNTALNSAYSGTTYDGTGVNIGIAGVSDLTLADVQNYRVAFLNETAATVNLPTVIVDGNDPGLNGAGDEALLDNEVAGGIAPKAKLYFYTSAGSDITDGLFNAVLRAIDDNTVSILSISFGACEAQEGTGGNLALSEIFQQAAAQGISVTVSAGDGGSAGCDDFDTETAAQDGLAVSALASTPYTVAVGGTDFDGLPAAFSSYANAASNGTSPYYRTALKYIPENPWNDSTSNDTTYANNFPDASTGQTNIVAGSGGVSSVWPKPAFQASLTPADNARDLPDVSLFASNGHKQAMWVLCSDSTTDGSITQTYTNCLTTNGQFTASTSFDGVGGTSASAPAFAGMLALVEQKTGSRLGQADYVLYQLAKAKYATVFHDITVGNNSVYCIGGSPNCGSNNFLTGYNAGTGYDLATGLGSVDAAAMVSNWSSVALTATSTSLNIGGSTAAYTGVHGATLTFNVGVNPTSATGNVAIIDNANQTSGGTASGPQNDGQFTIPLTSGAGSATWNGLPGGSYTVTAHYGGDTANAASSSTPISVTISSEASTTTLQADALNPLTGVPVSSLSSIPYGSEVVLDAQITGTAEGAKTQGLATGTVSFSDNGTALGTGTVSSQGNLASWPPLNALFTALPVGNHSATASYAGDSSYKPSTSAASAFTIVKAATTMTATAATPQITTAQQTVVNVSISTPLNLGALPTGSVTLSLNGKTLTTITSLLPSLGGSGTNLTLVLSGSATLAGSSLPVGKNAINVAYSGDSNYAAASQTVNVTVTASGNFTITSGANLYIQVGNSATAILTVTPSGGFTGQVNLSCAIIGGPVTGFSCSAPPVTITGTAAVTTMLTVTTTAATPPATYVPTITGTDAATGTIVSTMGIVVYVTTTPPVPGLSLSTNPSSLSFIAGATTGNTSAVSVIPSGAFAGAVNLTCSVTTTISNPVSVPTCSVTSPVTITDNNIAASTLTVTTTSTTSTGAYTIALNAADAATGAVTATGTLAVNITQPALVLSSSGAIVVSPGATTGNTSTISIAPSGGFTGTVNLACSFTAQPTGANDPPTCSIPATVNITDTTAATATLTVATTAPSTSALNLPLQRFVRGTGAALLALVLFFGIPARRRAWRALFSLLGLVVITGLIGCGGGSSTKAPPPNPGTTPGAYTITVTGTDAATGKITSSTTVNLTVN